MVRRGKKKKRLAVSLVFIVVILTLPFNIFMIYYAKKSQNVILENTQINISRMADLYINEIENKISSLNTFIINLEETNGDLANIVKGQDWDQFFISAIGLKNTMNSQMVIRKDANCYFFYSKEKEYGMLVENSTDFTQKELTDVCFGENLEKMMLQKQWQILEVKNTKWLFHIYNYHDLYLGAGIQFDTLEKELEEAIGYKGTSARFDKKNTQESNPEMVLISKPAAKEQFYLHIQIPRNVVVRKLPLMLQIGYWMAILEILLILILILSITYYVIKPLNILTMKIEELKTNRDARIRKDANTEEFAIVYDSFNHMADEIVRMKFESYEQKIRQQQISMRNLQLQVKPHFLFNSLSLMYNLVQMGEYKSAQQMILYLSKYFHYINIGDKDFSKFGDEFDLIQMYLEVSQIRYPDIFTVRYDVSEDVKDVYIPQLLIHNFVENIIKHGLVLTRKNQILVQAYIRHGEAVFRIEDDGRGIEKEDIEAINSGKFNYRDGKNHQGVRNSFNRIHFFYGDQAHIYFESEVNKGTIVAITLPVELLQKGEEDATVDRK